MTTQGSWLTIKQGSITTVNGRVDATAQYTIPQPQDTLAGFQLDAPVHPVDAHIEVMEADPAQEMFRDTFFEA
jgi:hypothetical protein